MQPNILPYLSICSKLCDGEQNKKLPQISWVYQHKLDWGAKICSLWEDSSPCIGGAQDWYNRLILNLSPLGYNIQIMLFGSNKLCTSG